MARPEAAASLLLAVVLLVVSPGACEARRCDHNGDGHSHGCASRVPDQQHAALLDLFVSTGGPQGYWQVDSGWADSPHVCNWFGVSCDQNGTNVVSLVLAGNGLTGTLPSLAALSTLRVLNLGMNSGITGIIPASVGRLKSLETLDLSSNMLSGEIGGAFRSTPLQYIDLSNNHLRGTIPAELGTAGSLNVLSLSNNLFTSLSEGLLDQQLGLITVDLSNNLISQPFPAGLFASSPYLATLDVSFNKFTGTLPSSAPLSKFINMHSFNVQDNMLCGDIPSYLGDLVTASSLSLQNNGFYPTVPESVEVLCQTVACALTPQGAPPPISACDHVPGMARHLSVTPSAVSASTVDVSWAQPTYQVPAVTYYVMASCACTSDPAQQACTFSNITAPKGMLPSNSSGPDSHVSTSVAQLTPGFAYKFSVAAVNSLGTSPWAQSECISTVLFNQTLYAPVSPTSGWTVEWTMSRGGIALLSFRISCVLDPGLPTEQPCPGMPSEMTVPPSTFRFQLPSLLPTLGHTVGVSVLACNTAGRGAAATQVVVPAAEPSPVTGVIGLGGVDRVTLAWTPPASSGGAPLSHYLVYGMPGSIAMQVQPQGSGQQRVVISSLSPGVEYTFHVQASNVAGLVGPAAWSGSLAPYQDGLQLSAANVALPVLVGLGLYALAAWGDRRHRRQWDGTGQGYYYTPLFWAAFAVVELGADYQFLKSTWVRLGGSASVLLSAHDRTLMRRSAMCFGAAWAVTIVGNVFMLVRIMAKVNAASRDRVVEFTARATRDLGLSSQGSLRFLRAKLQTMDEWRAVHRGAFWIVMMLSSLKMSVFPVLYCRAFGATLFSAPVSRLTATGREHPQARMINLRVSIMTVVEDLPQIIAILCVASVNNGWSSYSVMFALVASSVSLMYEMAVAGDLLCCTRDSSRAWSEGHGSKASGNPLGSKGTDSMLEPLLRDDSTASMGDKRDYPLPPLDETSYLWLLRQVPRDDSCGLDERVGGVHIDVAGRARPRSPLLHPPRAHLTSSTCTGPSSDGDDSNDGAGAGATGGVAAGLTVGAQASATPTAPRVPGVRENPEDAPGAPGRCRSISAGEAATRWRTVATQTVGNDLATV